jgi:uncharacterized membrane protein YjjP (DUF1212 family)
MHQTPEEKLHFIEQKLDKILVYMFGDISLDKDAQGFAMDIQDDIRGLKNILLEEINDVRTTIASNRQEIEKLKIKVEEIEKKQIKYSMQTAIMWAGLGGAAALIVEYLLQSMSKPGHAVIFTHLKTYLSFLKLLLL